MCQFTFKSTQEKGGILDMIYDILTSAQTIPASNSYVANS
jgi:hypothetical protein